jgi:uncharacterized protein YhjY with autotransporter beta-barrel domain
LDTTQPLSTNNFALTELPSSSYAFSITNDGTYNILDVVLLTLPVTPNGTTTINGASSYPSVTFGSNSTLDITPSGTLSVTSAVAVSHASTLNVDGILNSSNGVAVNTGSKLSGVGTINGSVTSGGTLTPVSSATGVSGKMSINGSLTLNPSSTLVIPVNGSTAGQVSVSGTATIGGTLAMPMASAVPFGSTYSILTASNIVGAFSAFDLPEGDRARVTIVGDPTLNVTIAPASYTQMAANQNQLNVAQALNSFIPATSGDNLTVSTALDSLAPGQYNQAFNAIMPTMYQSIATIAFNNANAQNSELAQRIWGLRVSDGGFSMSGLGDVPMLQEGAGHGVLDSKNDILRPGAGNHWGMFVDGNGIFAQANSGNMLPGYQSENGGVTTGLTYKWNDGFVSGLYAGYEGSYNKMGQAGSGLGVGSTLTDNAVRFGTFSSWGQKNASGEAVGFHANVLLGGAYNNYQVNRVIQFTGMNRTANSSPGAGELDSQLAGGYDIKKGNFTFGPMASLQYTYLGVGGFNETGAQSLDFNSGGWSTQSMISSLGAHVAYSWKVGKNMTIVPQLSLSWQHEFLQNPYDISGSIGGSPSFANQSSAPIRDSLYAGVGFTINLADKWNASLFYNASAGNADLSSQNVFLSIGRNF